ncbi:PLAC8-like protein 1 [Dromaius novaehollandiae]|uniref:PLAC8-like protein 1 n=1 Tax=Dromaius novaehollandiae TaxID=8790 RepID=UPI000E1E3B67|nr:PLAC8-like protein 1 isoform X1 [Dromaius novaehollandiae]XP_025974083.1 PLAC8-like protein 1 isoform X1 [Dromaius novaehollandiae]
MSISLSEIQSPFILSLITPEDGTSFLSGVNKKLGEPVTTQPAGTVGMSAITTVMWTGGGWSTGLFDVCSDKKICVCGALCSPCLECSLAPRAGECLCFPLLPGSTLALRVGTREKYKIQGTIYEDWIAVYCCWPFAVCQVARELKRRAMTQICEINATPLAEDVLVKKIPSKGA